MGMLRKRDVIEKGFSACVVAVDGESPSLCDQRVVPVDPGKIPS